MLEDHQITEFCGQWESINSWRRISGDPDDQFSMRYFPGNRYQTESQSLTRLRQHHWRIRQLHQLQSCIGRSCCHFCQGRGHAESEQVPSHGTRLLTVGSCWKDTGCCRRMRFFKYSHHWCHHERHLHWTIYPVLLQGQHEGRYFSDRAVFSSAGFMRFQ